MDTGEQDLTKSKKVVKAVACSQLVVGLLLVAACFGGIIFPYLGIVKINKVEYKLNPDILSAYKPSFILALDADYPEYKSPKTFWDKFVTIKVYDILIDSKQVSFCIKRDYRMWGLSLGQLERPEPIRYVVDSKGELTKIKDDINLGIICTDNRVIKQPDSDQ